MERRKLVELVPRIAQATEYLAKALIYALNTDERICKEIRDHDVGILLAKVCSVGLVPLI